jgi:class 3 adenylate cyclase
LAHLVNAYLHEMSKAVIGLVGHVLKRLGDGLMALFRYDTAQGTTRNAPRATSMSAATR